LAWSLCALVVAGSAVGFPLLYRHYRNPPPEADASAEPEPAGLPTHDELLGPPLSFETPAFLSIPAIGLEEEVREGSDDEEELYRILALGPVHIPHTGFPGWPGNCVISGHRTTKTRPFNRLDELKTGDAIFIRNPRGLYRYRVTEVTYVRPWVNVTLHTEEPILTLTTCAPEGQATLRLVVRAVLEDFTPVEEME